MGIPHMWHTPRAFLSRSHASRLTFFHLPERDMFSFLLFSQPDPPPFPACKNPSEPHDRDPRGGFFWSGRGAVRGHPPVCKGESMKTVFLLIRLHNTTLDSIILIIFRRRGWPVSRPARSRGICRQMQPHNRTSHRLPPSLRPWCRMPPRCSALFRSGSVR